MLMCVRKGKMFIIFSRYEHYVRFGQACFRNIINLHVMIRLRNADVRCWGTHLILTSFVYFQLMDFWTFRMLRDV